MISFDRLLMIKISEIRNLDFISEKHYMEPHIADISNFLILSLQGSTNLHIMIRRCAKYNSLYCYKVVFQFQSPITM